MSPFLSTGVLALASALGLLPIKHFIRIKRWCNEQWPKSKTEFHVHIGYMIFAGVTLLVTLALQVDFLITNLHLQPDSDNGANSTDADIENRSVFSVEDKGARFGFIFFTCFLYTWVLVFTKVWLLLKSGRVAEICVAIQGENAGWIQIPSFAKCLLLLQFVGRVASAVVKTGVFLQQIKYTFFMKIFGEEMIWLTHGVWILFSDIPMEIVSPVALCFVVVLMAGLVGRVHRIADNALDLDHEHDGKCFRNRASILTSYDEFVHLTSQFDLYNEVMGPIILGQIALAISSAIACVVGFTFRFDTSLSLILVLPLMITQSSLFCVIELGCWAHGKIAEIQRKLRVHRARVNLTTKDLTDLQRGQYILIQEICKWQWKMSGLRSFCVVDRPLYSVLVAFVLSYVVVLLQLN